MPGGTGVTTKVPSALLSKMRKVAPCNWLTSFTLAAGTYTDGKVLVRQTDLAGNTSAPSNTFDIKIDKTAPILTAARTGQAYADTKLGAEREVRRLALFVRAVLERDAQGVCRFQADLRNATDLAAALDRLAGRERWTAAVARDRQAVLDVFERHPDLFDALIIGNPLRSKVVRDELHAAILGLAENGLASPKFVHVACPDTEGGVGKSEEVAYMRDLEKELGVDSGQAHGA